MADIIFQNNRMTGTRASYMSESAAVQHEPEKIREAKQEYIRRTQGEVENRVLSNRLSARNFTKAQIVVLTMCTAAVLCVTAIYLMMISQVRKAEQQVNKMKLEYNMLVKENELTRDSIEASVDLAEVYRVATAELGMQVPQKNQMIVYDRPDSEYVVKVASMPTE